MRRQHQHYIGAIDAVDAADETGGEVIGGGRHEWPKMTHGQREANPGIDAFLKLVKRFWGWAIVIDFRMSRVTEHNSRSQELLTCWLE